MVTFNHGFSAYVCGRVAMPLLRRRAPVTERALGWAFFLGGMMPDADYASKVLGRAAYFSGDWFAHRSASHSILGTLVMALVAAALFFLPLTGLRRRVPASAYLWLAGCFWAGGLVHIVGDLFTPRLPIPVFWPLDDRYGGFSHIGWFSPYLLWLFLATLLIARGITVLAKWRPAFAPWQEGTTWLLFAVAAGRWLQFLFVSRYDSFAQWSEYQRSLLPDTLVNAVTSGVSFLWYWLTG